MTSIFIVSAILFAAFVSGTLYSYSGFKSLLKRPLTIALPFYGISFLGAYLLLIPLHIKSPVLWGAVLLYFSAGFGLFSLSRLTDIFGMYGNSNLSLREKKGVITASLAWSVYIVLSSPLSALIDDEPYKNAITVENQEVFDPKSVLLDGDQARFVDQDLAIKGVKELIGEELGLGSRFEFDDATIQQVGDKLNWVAPLKHQGLIKWWNNKTTPGYAYISVNDYDSSDLILNESVGINYGHSGFFFSKDVRRHVYTNGYSREILSGKPRFEITNDGTGYWVFTSYEKGSFLSINKPNGVVTVDAKTGHIEKYGLYDAPKWIDTIYTDVVTENLISYTFGYVKGAINAWFVGEDVITASKGTYMVYTKSGEAKWYTGMQSSGAQEGTMGFVLSDTRTGVATLYRKAGITEMVAKDVAEGLVQDLGYSSSAPIPHNVNGINTFVSILKDASGNKQGVALVRYTNRNVAGWGKSLQEAERRYMTAMAQQQDASSDVVGGDELYTITADVFRVTHLDDTSYIMLSNLAYSDNMFSVAHAKDMKVIMTKPGDKVTIKVVNLDVSVVPVVGFNNDSIESRTSQVPSNYSADYSTPH